MGEGTNTFYARLERVAFVLTLVLVPVVLAVAGWTTQEHPNRIDRYLFEQMGETVLDGGTVYLDCWDNKPPGLCWWNALVLFFGGRSTFAVTVATVFSAIAVVVATGWGVARIHGRSVAALTMAIFALLLSQRYFDALTNGSEFYAMAAECFAALFLIGAMTGCGRRVLLQAFLAGVAWGVAGMMKQTGAAGPIAAVLVLVVYAITGPGPKTRFVGRFFMMSAGVVLVVAAVAWVLERQGALGEAYYASVAFNLDPETTGGAPWSFHLPRLLRQLTPLVGVGLLAAVGAIITFIPDGRGLDAGTAEPSGAAEQAAATSKPQALPCTVVVVLLVWIAIATYGVSLGPNHMPRYWHAVFAPGIWLVAQGLRFVLDICAKGSARRRWTAVIGTAALAAMLLRPLAQGVYADAMIAYYYTTSESERGRLIEVGRRIAARTDPTDEIYVWGYSPGVYRFSSRRAACRFAGLDKLNNTGAAAHAFASEIVTSLRERRPKLIAVEQRYLGDLLSDRAKVVAVEGLAEWFQGNYEQAETVGGFLLYLRRE